jgi:hypothetical protein
MNLRRKAKGTLKSQVIRKTILNQPMVKTNLLPPSKFKAQFLTTELQLNLLVKEPLQIRVRSL